MKKFKWVWVLGISAAVFLGPLGTLDLSGQKQIKPQIYEWTIPKDFKVSPEAKLTAEKWIEEGNDKLRILFRNLEYWDAGRINKELPDIKRAFENTYLKSPMIQQDLGAKGGWDDVIWEFHIMAKKFQNFGQVSIRVILLPDEVVEKTHRDFRMDISIPLMLNPPNNPTLRGCGLHRLSCDPEECQ